MIGRSPSYPEAQWRSAVDLAERFDVPLLELDTRELDDPRYLAQRHRPLLLLQVGAVDPSRARSRRRQGFDTIIDGTNADDLGEHRPGLRAGARSSESARRSRSSAGARRPCVRRRRALGLPDLGRAGRALSLEPGALRARDHAAAGCARWRTARRTSGKLGVAGDLRVRHHGRHAHASRSRPAEMPTLRARWDGGGALLRGARLRSGGAGPGGVSPRRAAGARAAWPNLMRLFAALPIAEPARREIVDAAGPPARAGAGRSRWVHDDGAAPHPQVLRRGARRAARRDRGGGARSRCRAPAPLASPARRRSARFPAQRRPRMLWVGLDAPPALELLQDRLERRAEAIGFPPEGTPFRPHVTLGRVREGHRLPHGALEGFGRAVRAGRRSWRRSWCSTRACSTAAGRATSRGSRWSSLRDGLSHRAVQGARLPRAGGRAGGRVALPGSAGARGTAG